MMTRSESCKDQRGHCLSPEGTPLTYVHISLAGIGHMALIDYKWARLTSVLKKGKIDYKPATSLQRVKEKGIIQTITLMFKSIICICI
jgi:nucleoside recognition membrane protein YjiH